MPRFVIGHFAFKTKAEATQEVRRILHSTDLDKPLTGRDLSLVSALYQMHPRRDGTPHSFCVSTNIFHGATTRGFQTINEQGEYTSWSYIPCLSPQTDTPSMFRVMRAAIMLSQREALHAAYRGRAIIPCSNCKAGVTLQTAQVHHLPPKFRDIADAFIGLLGAPEVVIAELGDDFASQEVRKRWIMFHDAVAHRVVLCPPCNAADEKSA